jgi:16S rRNA (cytosine1402-N4)-methyltransferase
MTPHISVLLQPILRHLLPAERVIDGTLGAGGHTRALLEQGAGTVLGLDLDLQAIALATANLASFGQRAVIRHASYEHMTEVAAGLGWNHVDVILLDVGVSSMQLDTAGRGFAFMQDGPLDMRFDPTGSRPSAADIVNTYDETELADLIFHYGEEPESRRLARLIVAARPYATTLQLASRIESVRPRRKGDKIHPATRVFQALRIAVNDELGAIERTLPQAIELLRPGGRVAVISFHSLEDRIVKQTFRQAATDCICPPRTPICVCGHKATIRLLTHKPIVADDTEIAHNPRSRSAKLRIIEKL